VYVSIRVTVRVRVRFMVWVRGEMSGRGKVQGKFPALDPPDLMDNDHRCLLPLIFTAPPE